MPDTAERIGLLERAVAHRDGALRLAESNLRSLESRDAEIASRAATEERAIELAGLCVTEKVRVKEDIEELATLALRAVFGDKYRFELAVEQGADGVVSGLSPTIWEWDDADSPTEFGGGVSNVASLAVRTVFVLLDRDMSPIMVLDEPNVNLDVPKWERFVAFMDDLVSGVGAQVLIVTHAGVGLPQTFKVTRPRASSVVEEVA